MLKILTIPALILLAFFGCGKDSGVSYSGSSPVTGKAGSTARFAIAGNYLYALDGSDIVCFDISSGASPVLKSRIKVAMEIETIYPYQDKLFIGSRAAMYAYSLTDPANPSMISQVSHVRSCDPVVVQGNFAYVTLRAGTFCGGGNTLNVYNVTNISQPVFLKSIALMQPNGLGVNGNALYVTQTGGLRVFNIAQPDNPVQVTDIAETGSEDVIPYNNTMYVQSNKGTTLYDAASPLAPVFLSRINK